MTPGQDAAALTARVLYASLVGGFLMISGVFVGMRLGANPVDLTFGPWQDTVFRAVTIVTVLVGTVVVRAAASRLPARRAGASFSEWWKGGGLRAVVVWAIAEGVGAVGPVLYLLTGDVIALAITFLWAVAVFVRYTPGRLGT